MAQRRMFSLKIIDTDNFLSMPISTRLLYYDLSMRADDDGFVDSPKKIMKIVGATDDDFKVLCAKQYIFPFETGVCVIKDWKIHNYIQNDRYQGTHYTDEKKMLSIDDKGAYTKCIQNVSTLDTQVRLGKDRIGKVKEYIIITDCEHIKLTQDQYDILITNYGKDVIDKKILDLENYIVNGKGQKYRDHKRVIETWLRHEGMKKRTDGGFWTLCKKCGLSVPPGEVCKCERQAAHG